LPKDENESSVKKSVQQHFRSLLVDVMISVPSNIQIHLVKSFQLFCEKSIMVCSWLLMWFSNDITMNFTVMTFHGNQLVSLNLLNLVNLYKFMEWLWCSSIFHIPVSWFKAQICKRPISLTKSKQDICEIVHLYSIHYEEEFSMLPQFIEHILNLLASTLLAPKFDLLIGISLCNCNCHQETAVHLIFWITRCSVGLWRKSSTCN